MWSRLSHTLAPLTNIIPSKVKFKWNKIEQGYFEEIKRTVACDTLLTYSDFNEEFKIHTKASNLQLGAFIIQNGKPTTFYGIELTDNQKMIYSKIKGAVKHCWNFKRV